MLLNPEWLHIHLRAELPHSVLILPLLLGKRSNLNFSFKRKVYSVKFDRTAMLKL